MAGSGEWGVAGGADLALGDSSHLGRAGLDDHIGSGHQSGFDRRGDRLLSVYGSHGPDPLGNGVMAHGPLGRCRFCDGASCRVSSGGPSLGGLSTLSGSATRRSRRNPKPGEPEPVQVISAADWRAVTDLLALYPRLMKCG